MSSINIPNSVESIGDLAFLNCYSLTSIVLGSGVSQIAGQAFQSSNLSYVLLPASLTKIEQFAFGRCSNLTTINFTGTQEPELGERVFGECYNIRDIFAPDEYEEDTLFGMLITRDLGNEDMKQVTQISIPIVVFLTSACVFSVIEVVTSRFHSSSPEDEGIKRNVLYQESII